MESQKLERLARTIDRSATKPLADQSLNKICELFQDVQDLTYVFVGSSEVRDHQVDEYGQDYLSALELSSCVTRGMPFRRPFQYESETDDDQGITKCRRQIQKEVEARVREMKARPDTSFVLLWNIAGSEKTHCAASSGYSLREIQSQLISLFSNLMCEYVV